MSTSQLERDFTILKADVFAKFKDFSFLEEESFRRILEETIRSHEKEALLSKIHISIVAFGIASVLLIGFAIFLIFFTVPF